MFWTKFSQGAVAGAAGVTALNAITYLDMAVRARPSSSTPSQAVEEMAHRAGASIPGEGDDHDNRLAGLGPLTGILTGLATGIAAAFARPVLARLPAPLAVMTVGALAMVGADGPLVGLGLTKPGEWGTADWLSDIVPHLGFGAATYATLTAMSADAHA
jgi:hypothetical protein